MKAQTEATGGSGATTEERLPLAVCLGFGVGSLGIAILLNTITTFFPALMTTVLGQSAALAGLLLTISKLYDVFADIVIGVSSDRTKSRWGRRRPYLLAGAVVSAFSFLMIFIPPSLSDDGLIIYMAAALIIYSTGYSLFAVPYIAMAGEMTDDYNERTRLLSFRTFFVSVGQMAGMAGTAALVDWAGGGERGYAVLGAACASVIFTAMTICFFGTKNARRAEPQPKSHMPGMEQVRSLWENKPFVLLIGAKVTQFMAISIFTTTKLLFLLNVMKVGYSGLMHLSISQNIVGMISVPLWTWIGKRYGKTRGYMAAIILLTAMYLSWLITGPTNNIWDLWLRGALNGLAATGTTLMSISMLPDVMEYDRKVTGERREGVFSSIYAMVEKLSFAIGPGLIGLILAMAGYAATTGGAVVEQSAEAVDALYLGMAVIPAILAGISFFFMWNYKLDAKTLKDMPTK